MVSINDPVPVLDYTSNLLTFDLTLTRSTIRSPESYAIGLDDKFKFEWPKKPTMVITSFDLRTIRKCISI